MEITGLEIDNFLTIGMGQKLTLNGQGLVIIQGDNQDDTSTTSNGAGKSSIPDAPCWCLWGTTARGITGDAVVNKTAKKNCRVKMDLLDGPTTYRIVRYRKHATGKNGLHVTAIQAGTTVDMTRGTERETQALIAQIMGCSREVFMASVYAGQEQMPDLPGMTDKNLKMLVEEAAGTDRLEAAYEIARKKHSATEVALNLVIASQTKNTNDIQVNDASLVATQARIEEFENSRAPRIQKIGNDILVAAQSLKTAFNAMQEAKTKLEGLKSALPADANAAVLDFHSKTKLLEVARAVVRTQEIAKSRCDTNVDAALSRFSNIKSRYENAATELAKPCTECGKAHTEAELEEFKAHLLKHLAAAGEELKALRKTCADQTAVVLNAQQALLVAAAAIPDIAEYASKMNEINVAQAVVNDFAVDLQRKKAGIETWQANIKGITVEVNPHTATLRHLESVRDALTKVHADLEDTHHHATVRKTLAEMVMKVFSPAGVRAHILDTVTPFLNERTAEYLSVLADGNINAVWTTLVKNASGELREKFSIEVTNDKGAESFGGLSGGEKRKVRLATMLALQDLVATRAIKPINLWIGDEIDDAMDPAGLERLMTILERKARDRGTVLIISHNNLTDWVDEVCLVTKSGGTSQITGALCEV